MTTTTLVLFLSPWGIWLVWELWILWQRRSGHGPETISMVARDFGPRLTVLTYLWGGMAAHWWLPAKAFAPTWAGVLFWAVPVALLVWDLALIHSEPKDWPMWLRTVRLPPVWLAVGALAGRFLFPQVGP